MNKTLGVLLLLVLLFSCTAFADTGELAIDGDFTAIAVQGNTVYLLDKERNLFMVQAGQAFPETPACTLSREADFLMFDQGVLYGWQPVQDALFHIDTTTGEVISERTAGITDAFDIRDGYSKYDFYAPMLHDGTLTVHWEGPYHEQGIDQFALDGTHTSYDLDGDGTLFHGDPNGRMVVVPDWCGAKELGQLDVQEGEFTWYRQMPLDTWGIASHGEKVYVGAGNYIEQYESLEATSGQIAACLPQTVASLGTQSMKILDDGWVALISDGTFYLRRLDVNRCTQVLTLPPELYYAREMSEAFLSEYPDVALRFANWWKINPSTLEDYQQAIENLEADILVGYLDDSTWQALKDGGYAADLSASAVLQQAVGEMYPAFRDACMGDGKTLAIPLAWGLDWRMLQIDKNALMDQTGLFEEELPKTFLEFPEALNPIAAQYSQISPEGELLDTSLALMLCKAFMEQYVFYYEGSGEPLVFDTALFRAGLSLKDQVPRLPSVGEEGVWSEVIAYRRMPFSVNRAPSILPLALDGEQPYTLPITLSLVFINPNSPNLELAIAYLERAVVGMPLEKKVMWMPGDWEPVLNSNYEAELAQYNQEAELVRATAAVFADDEMSWYERILPGLEKDCAEFAQYGRWLVSPEFLQGYGSLAEQMVIFQQGFFETGWRATEHARTANTLRTQYLSGEIDADALIVGLQRIADTRWAAEE